MTLAYLITAYDQPEHLARLVRALDAEGSRIFIHIDAKVPLEPFVRLLPVASNVVLLQDRVRVQWMGFSQVESILRLMREALRTDPEHLVLLSGSDYPIKSNEQIHSFYAGCSEQLLSFWRIEDRPSWWHKLEYWYPVDLIPIHGWTKGTETRFWRRYFWGRYFKYRRFLPKRRLPAGWTFYGGSDWWSLTADCARSVLRLADENPALLRFFRHTLCPSDMFFQTAVLNSDWASTVRNFRAYQAWRERKATVPGLPRLPEADFNLRYIDWSRPAGGREAPADLDVGDWPQIAGSACLFARKFIVDRSDGLLKHIDRETGRGPVGGVAAARASGNAEVDRLPAPGQSSEDKGRT